VAAVEVGAMKVVGSSVGAVTSLDDELFVSLRGSAEIHVYDCDHLQLVRCLPVDELGQQVTCFVSLSNNNNNDRLTAFDPGQPG